MNMNIHFAPLQGFTTYIYRNTHNIVFNNISKYYSPFVRLENNTFKNKDIKDIGPTNNTDISFTPQIIAGTPDEAKTLIDMLISKGYRNIDINMGCPFPLITKKCKGAGILTYPDKVKAILDILDNFEEISFSLKIRSGMNESSECMQLADIINESRIDYVTMHPRTGIQQYKGLADRTVYKDFADRCSKLMIYNGDIKTIDDIKSIEDITPNTKGVMIGRGLLENPALAMEYNEGKQMETGRKVRLLQEFHSLLFNQYSSILQGDSQILSHLQPIWEYLYPEMEKKHRKKIVKCTKISNYLRAVEEALK